MIDLSNFMYRSSGFFRRVVDYFVDNAMYLPNIDTKIYNNKFFEVESETLNENYINFAGAISKLGLETEMRKIFIRVFLEDACFAYFLEGLSGESFLYYIPSAWCSVRKTYDGVPIYGINPQAIPQCEKEKLPDEIRQLLNQPTTSQDPYVYPKPNKCFVIKYNSHLTYLYPPLFDLIKDIVDIDDYKELTKAKMASENYNLLALEIPAKNDGQLDDLLFTDNVISPTYNMARSVLPSSVGLIASPLPVKEIQWKSNSAEKNGVQGAIDNFYDSAGVPKALMGSGTGGSIIKSAILNDATVLFKLYRQIEEIVNLKMSIDGFNYGTHRFMFKMLDVTYLTQKDAVEKQLRLAQASAPNKTRLMACAGVSPSEMMGNDYMENAVLGIGLAWTPLKTSYIASNNSDKGGEQDG